MLPTLNPALRDFWQKPARHRILYGGRDSSKSWDAAGVAVAMAQYTKLRFLCARQFQNKIAESVYTLLKIQIERFGLRDQFAITEKSIRHKRTGSEFMFYGLWRHVNEIKSLESIDILWIEEGHFLTKTQFDILEPTIRKEGSQIWLIFNPDLISDFVWQRFVVNTPPNSVVRKINYTENPFLSNTSRAMIERRRDEDPEDFAHVYLGEPRQDNERAIIKRSWVLAAIDAHLTLGIKPSGQVRIGFDIMDDGEDLNATVTAYGFLTLNISGWKGEKDNLLKNCTRVYNLARKMQAHIYYDDIGVGAAAGGKFAELNEATGARIRYSGFGAGEGVHDPDAPYKYAGYGDKYISNRDYFANLKAQAWWHLADRLRNTYNAVTHGQKFREDELIAINSKADNLEKLINELTTPLKDVDHLGRNKVQSKKDLGIPSHNFADAFVMAYNPRLESHIDFGAIL